MEITERRAGRAVILAPAGRIDATTEKEFRERLIPLVQAAGRIGEWVVIDFSGVDYISSAGLRVLMLARKEASPWGGKIAVAALKPDVNEIFQITRFDKVVQCHAGVDEAIAALGSGS